MKSSQDAVILLQNLENGSLCRGPHLFLACAMTTNCFLCVIPHVILSTLEKLCCNNGKKLKFTRNGHIKHKYLNRFDSSMTCSCSFGTVKFVCVCSLEKINKNHNRIEWLEMVHLWALGTVENKPWAVWKWDAWQQARVWEKKMKKGRAFWNEKKSIESINRAETFLGVRLCGGFTESLHHHTLS